MENLLEKFISQILLGTGLLTSLALWLKGLVDKKRLKQELNNNVNKGQDQQLELLNNKLDEDKKEHLIMMEKLTFIYDNTKNGIFQTSIKKQLKKQLSELLAINEIESNEFTRIMYNTLNGFLHIISDILLYDFKVDTSQLNDIIKYYFDNVKRGYNRNKLDVNNPDNFIKQVEDEILNPSIKAFEYKFSELKILENGVRRKTLENLSINYNEENTIKIIQLYLKNKKID